VKGVDAIIHTASPVHLDAKDPKGKEAIRDEKRPRKRFELMLFPIDLIDPAVKGATGILASAMAHG
jgi:hypothetical protein